MSSIRLLYFGLLALALVIGLALVVRPGMEEPPLPENETKNTTPIRLPESQYGAENAHILQPLWMRKAASSPPVGNLIPIVIVIDDMGHNARLTEAVIGLPAPLTLSFLPYPERAGEQARAARTRGHEIMLHMPMESADNTADEGPDPLLLSHGVQESENRLDAALGTIPDVVGLNNHMGSLYTEDPLHMAWLADMVAERGLLFLDSRTSPRTRGAEAMRTAGVPVLERDVFLDNKREPAAIRRQLDELERTAREQGYAVGIGHPYEETIAVLEDWLTSFSDRGFVLVPASRLLMGADGLSSGAAEVSRR